MDRCEALAIRLIGDSNKDAVLKVAAEIRTTMAPLVNQIERAVRKCNVCDSAGCVNCKGSGFKIPSRSQTVLLFELVRQYK